MKLRILSILLILTIFLSLASCKSVKDNESALPNIEVETTEDGQSTETDNATETEPPKTQSKPKKESEGSKSETPADTEKQQNTTVIFPEDEYGQIIETGGSSYDYEYRIPSAVTNDNGFIRDDYQRYDETESIELKEKANVFTSTADNNVSTFGVDVDTASYSNVRMMLLDNLIPYDGDIRIEEMINYFSYDYGTPKDDKPFSVVGEIFDCPWNSETKLVRIGLGTEQPDYASMPPSNLVFLIDVSGSMNTPNKLPLVKQAFSMLIENLRPTDRISIVTYASSDKVVLDGAHGNDQTSLHTAIENLSAGGGTYGSQGIITAYKLAEKHFIEGGNNRVILATDGDLNIGITNPDDLEKLITDKKESGVYLSVMGFGTTYNDETLETLADNGNGNYNYITTQNEARRVFVEQMSATLFTVAKDVKLQVEFDKEVVSEYRLLGYDNRVMPSEDFADDTKDGGEIGAGHRVTALYEIKVEKTSADKWFDLNVRYKERDGETSILDTYSYGYDDYTTLPSEDSIFAASVAQFGMLLRGTEDVGSYDDVIKRLGYLECVKSDDYKKELLELVKIAKSLKK